MLQLRAENRLLKYVPPDDIKRLQGLVSSFVEDRDKKEFDLGGGIVAVVTNLLRKDGVGVVETEIPDGAVFPLHNHSVYEWLIPYRGTMRVEYGGDVYMVGPDREMRYMVFPPDGAHEVSAVGDVRLIGITVPADEGYPGVGL